MTNSVIYLPPGCDALREMQTASGCRGNRYFQGLAADSPNGCCEHQAVRNRHRGGGGAAAAAAAAVDVVVDAAAAAADGGDGGSIPSFRCR